MLLCNKMTLANEHAEACGSSDHRPIRSNPGIGPESLDGAARLFRALGDGPRLRLLTHLIAGERCVGELAELEGESLSTISQRLRILRSEKIITRRRSGKHVNYALADRHIADLVINATAHAAEPVSADKELE